MSLLIHLPLMYPCPLFFPAVSAALAHHRSCLLSCLCTSVSDGIQAQCPATSPDLRLLLDRSSSKLHYHHFLMKSCYITFLSDVFDVTSHKMKSQFTYRGTAFGNYLCSPAFSTLFASLFIGCCYLTLASNYSMCIPSSLFYSSYLQSLLSCPFCIFIPSTFSLFCAFQLYNVSLHIPPLYKFSFINIESLHSSE